VEHLLIVLVELGRWIDRSFQKSLKKAIPEFDHLLRDPRGTLAGGPITIGPAKKYGSGIFIGLLVALIGSALAFLVFVLAAGPNAGNREPHLILILLLILLVILLGSFWVVFYLLRGGQATLTLGGVELAYRGTVVACPWALFNAAGQPFLPRPDRMLLPVSSAAIPFVEQRGEENVQATGERVNTRQLKFKSGTEAALRPLYEVNLADLGGLLLRLGRVLGLTLPEGLALPADEPVRAIPVPSPDPPDRNGWITVRLTRLVFPPFCCDCGRATDQVKEFIGHAALLRLGRYLTLESGESARFHVPLCGDCQQETGARFRRIVFKGVVVGLVIGLLLTAALTLLFRDADFLWILAFPLGLLGGLHGLGIGRRVAKEKTQPVRLERYSPSRGTIAIRFRWRAYGERLFAYLEAQEELHGEALPGRAVVGNRS